MKKLLTIIVVALSLISVSAFADMAFSPTKCTIKAYSNFKKRSSSLISCPNVSTEYPYNTVPMDDLVRTDMKLIGTVQDGILMDHGIIIKINNMHGSANIGDIAAHANITQLNGQYFLALNLHANVTDYGFSMDMDISYLSDS